MNINLNYYFNNPRNLTIIIYIITIIILYLLKPNIIFDTKYNLKKIKINSKEYYFPYYIFSILLAVLIYYIIQIYYIKLKI